MKTWTPLSLVLALTACGSSEAPSNTAGKEAGARSATEAEKQVEPPLTVQKAAAPALLPDDPTLGGKYLVILASKLDPAETEPALALAKAQGSAARTLLSSRFKNLMPCYTVAFAEAFADKKAAFALSKKLMAAGVDNYVKNAGDYVGPSPAIDAFCGGMSGQEGAEATARVVVKAGGKSWLPVDGSVPDGLPEPMLLDDDYSSWLQPLAADAGPADEPPKWSVLDVQSGVVKSCSRVRYAALTLGTPHFGTLQGDEKPTAPSCGSPAIYAELDCDLSGPYLVAVPEGGKAPVALSSKGEQAALEAEATKALSAVEGWRDYSPTDTEAEVRRTVKVLRYEGPGGAYHVVTGEIEDGAGVCGGDEVAFRALYAAEGEGLGRRLSPFVEEHFSRLEGVLDLESDGAPELYTVAFPNQYGVWRIDGTQLTGTEIAFCDCAC